VQSTVFHPLSRKEVVKVKVKFTLEQTTKAQRYSSTLSLTSALDVGGWSTPRPDRSTPGKETLYPFYRRVLGSQGRSGRVRKISPLPGFDLRIVQPVASRHTNCAMPVTKLKLECLCSFA